MGRYRPLAERFAQMWTPEPNTGCWLWTGSLVAAGYGNISGERSGTPVAAYRVSLDLAGVVVTPGLRIINLCGIRSCVNPRHWRGGSMSDSLTLARQRGRMPARHGEHGSRAVLSQEQVDRVRALVGAGEISQQLAAKLLGVNSSTVSRIMTGHAWPPKGRAGD